MFRHKRSFEKKDFLFCRDFDKLIIIVGLFIIVAF